MMVVIFKPFKVGDFIAAGGTMGTVVEIGIFTTVLDGPDNRREIVPNAQVTGGNITNFSGIDRRRVDLVFGISYDSDIRKAKEVLERVCSGNQKVLKEPKPVVAVSALADSSVNLVCRPWCKPGDYWDVYFETLEKGKLELEKAGIVIPFPQRDVHLYQEKAQGN
jgi:small conductance mechanosensitive channel